MKQTMILNRDSMENDDMTFEQWFLLLIISQSVCNNRQLYGRLNTSLKPTDNVGEAFYGSSGSFKELIVLAEQGYLCPIYVWSLQFEHNEAGKQYCEVWLENGNI